MKTYNIEQLAYAIGMMKSLQAQHPKATLLFNAEDGRVDVTYPMPIDMLEPFDIRRIKRHDS